MTGMKAVTLHDLHDLHDLHEGFFSGALSVERLDGALRPCRLPPRWWRCGSRTPARSRLPAWR